MVAIPFQMNHGGFEVWGYTVTGFVADYVLSGVSTVCLGYILARTKRPYNALYKVFAVFLAAQAISFLSSGLAHHIGNIFANTDLDKGSISLDSDSGWMYPWMLSVALTPIYSACLVAMVFIFLNWPAWIAVVSVGIGILTAGYEIAILYHKDLDLSGMYDRFPTLRAASASFISLLILLIAMVGRCAGLSKMACWSREAQIGILPLFAGVFCMSAAWGLVLGTPASCSRIEAARAGCPFPEQFNHNAIFHALLILAAPLLCCGVRFRMLSASTPSKEINSEKNEPSASVIVDIEKNVEAPATNGEAEVSMAQDNGKTEELQSPTCVMVDIEKSAEAPTTNGETGVSMVEDNGKTGEVQNEGDTARPTLLDEPPMVHNLVNDGETEQPAPPDNKPADLVHDQDVSQQSDQANTQQNADTTVEKERIGSTVPKPAPQEDIFIHPDNPTDEAAPKPGCEKACVLCF